MKYWLALIAALLGLALSPNATRAFDPAHAVHDSLLQRYVRDGWVDYGAMRGSAEALDAYLAALADARPESFPTDAHRIAFWINAYNACVLRGVLDRYPLESVREWRFLKGWTFFYQQRHQVARRSLSLDAIENEVLRERFGDPRIHFALVCASRSCPALSNRAFVGATLDDALEEAAWQFINDLSKNRLDRECGVLYLSKIFDWYREDFEAAAGGSLTRYVARYLSNTDVAYLKAHSVSIEFLDYDWRLNGQ